MAIDPDKQLLDQCLNGDPHAWETFIKRFSPLVYYAIQTVVHPTGAMPDELIDLHNEIFLSLMENGGRKLRQYEGKNGCSLSTWIRVIAVRASIDYLKRQKTLVSLSGEDAGRRADVTLTLNLSVDEQLVEDEEKRILKELIDDLPPGDRLFLRLLYYEEVPPADIAHLFHTTPNAVYSRGNYLREKLKEALRKKMCKSGDT
ncbi:MAG: sigma-70 family RNA polymerase sigma factor [Desulfobacterota bacterium]|nr:sigma-70 family RNA polymerase sigma factor [Thermodesulfobacteriota bacterium]